MSQNKIDPLTRRAFIQGAASAAATPLARSAQVERPNLLWLVWEDIGPHLHCCGDEYSSTPNFDRLAKRGCVYENVWASAPVCAPARTAIISGVCPTSTGAEHMRSMTRLPAGWKMFPGYLREAGYYCVNNGKEDYNLEKPEGTWDISWDMAAQAASGARGGGARGGRGEGGARGAGGASPIIPPINPANGHWRTRKPGQPFLAVFNDMGTHESQIFRSATNRNFNHDPGKAWLAAFQPDTPEMRRDWAQYHDLLTMVDSRHQARLDELEQDGLTQDTIIVVTSDHGSGVARYKRMPYDSGLHVPMIVIFPEKYRHLAPKDYVPGGKSDRLIGTIDLGPTMLSLAGVKPPDFYHGRAFAGHYEAPPRSYVHGMRGRMDERYDLMRSSRDKRYVYIRNYNPHKIYGQHLDYAWMLPSTPAWEKLYEEGKLKPPQTYFWETKPAEELYDLQQDPSEVNNLASSAAHKAMLERFRKAHHKHELDVRDVGLLPEGEMHARAKDSTPYEMGHDPNKFPAERILAAADLATSGRAMATQQLKTAMSDRDAGVRYWGAMGALIRGSEEVRKTHESLTRAMTDSSPHVRIAAAEALGKYGSDEDLKAALAVLIELADSVRNHSYVAMHALNAIDALGKKAAPLKDQLAGLTYVDPKSPARVNEEYTTRLVNRLRARLG
jgi:arylsulfatase A-like enzyme